MQDRSSSSSVFSILLVVLAYAFLYIPIVVLALFSLNAAQFPAPWTGFTWHWYQELWQSTHLWTAVYNSLIVAVCATLLSLVMGVGLIFYCMQSQRVTKLIDLFYINLVIPEVVLAVGLLTLFTYGMVPLGLRTLIVAHTALGIGYVIPILYVRFASLSPGLIESSLDLGATTKQTFFKIILPLLRPALLTAGLLVFILSFDDFVLSYFCAGSSAQTLSLYILAMLRSGISPVINALSVILLLLSSVLVLIFCSYNVRSRIF
jgi:spermidine/putrescine transport system permease protein